MLASVNRLTSAEDFRQTVRRGRRRGGPLVVLHTTTPDVDKSTSRAPRVGFVVSKAVGSAVTRNRVKRRLRNLMRERLTSLPAGSLVVVRAQPAAATATFTELGVELDRCLGRA